MLASSSSPKQTKMVYQLPKEPLAQQSVLPQLPPPTNYHNTYINNQQRQQQQSFSHSNILPMWLILMSDFLNPTTTTTIATTTEEMPNSCTENCCECLGDRYSKKWMLRRCKIKKACGEYIIGCSCKAIKIPGRGQQEAGKISIGGQATQEAKQETTQEISEGNSE